MSFEKVIIGNATLYRGDWRDLPGELAAAGCVITDPPYGTGGWRRSAAGGGSNPAGKLIREAWDDGCLDWLEACSGKPVLTFWTAEHMGRLAARAAAVGYTKTRMLYMRKLDPKPQVSGRVSWAVEPIVALGHEGFQLWGGTDWHEASTPRLNRDADATGHPYQKPITTMRWLVDKVRVEDIRDPFMGSGTTGVAAVQAGRRFVGFERERDYFDIACRRIEQAQQQAVLFEPAPPQPEQAGLAI